MGSRRKLRDINPFDLFLFRTCYYHQMMMGYGHFGVGTDVFLTNYLSFYAFDEEKRILSVRDAQVLDDDAFEAHTGVRCERIAEPRDLTAEIKRRLDRSCPVLVAVDCFSLTHRADKYGKEHIIHYILVYGYDDEKQAFITMEHMYVNSLLYREFLIPYEVLTKAHESYLRYLAKENANSIVVLRRVKRVPPRPPKDLFALYRTHAEESAASLAAFRSACRYLKEVFTDPDVYREAHFDVQGFLGVIRWRKLTQKHVFQYYYHNEEIAELLERIVDDYIFLFGVTIKLYLSRIWSEEVSEKAVGRVEELEALETKLHRLLAEGV